MTEKEISEKFAEIKSIAYDLLLNGKLTDISISRYNNYYLYLSDGVFVEKSLGSKFNYYYRLNMDLDFSKEQEELIDQIISDNQKSKRKREKIEEIKQSMSQYEITINELDQ